MRPTVYLAGPIAGCDRGEANDWRASVAHRLERVGIRGISPLRCEPLVGERYTVGYEDPRFGTARAIAAKNLNDVRMCDFTLAYMPRALNERRLSIGTICELAWARAFDKSTILVSDYPLVIEHPVVQANAGWMLPTLDDALEVLLGVLKAYA